MHEQPVTADEPTTTTEAPGEVDGYAIEVTDTTTAAEAAQSGVEADRAAQGQDIPRSPTPPCPLRNPNERPRSFR